MNILLVTSATKGSNTSVLNREFILRAELKGHAVRVLDARKANHCIGCRSCEKLHFCPRFSDTFQISKDKLEKVIVFSGAIYSFGLNSALCSALNRLSFMTSEHTVFGLILCSGSFGRYSGLDIIESQFARFDEYCGTHTVPIVNKVTNDERHPLYEIDKVKISELLENLEEAYNIEKIGSQKESGK